MGTEGPKRWRPRRPWHYLLLAGVFFVVVIAASSVGAILAAHHVGRLQELPIAVTGAGIAGILAMLRLAYVTGVRDPAIEKRTEAAARAAGTGQPVPARLPVALRAAPPEVRGPRWRHGRVRITPQRVTWKRLGAGRERDLTGGRFISERGADLTYTEMALRVPGSWPLLSITVVTLRKDGQDVELAAPASVIEILRHALARGGGTDGRPGPGPRETGHSPG